MFDELLTADELANVLDVRPGTIRRWTRDGIIPEIRISAKVRRYCYADVLKALRDLASQQNEEGAANE